MLQNLGTVLGTTDGSKLTNVRIKLRLTDSNEKMDPTGIGITFSDVALNQALSSSNFTVTKSAGSPERGSSTMIDLDEIWELVANIPVAASVNAHDWVIITVVPPSGASITIKRTLPAFLTTNMQLH